jgi:hypothetical protein
MKKNKNITPRQIALALLSIIALVIVLPSCAHFHDEPTKSVWAGGLWIVIFWLPFLGSLLVSLRGIHGQSVRIIQTG